MSLKIFAIGQIYSAVNLEDYLTIDVWLLAFKLKMSKKVFPSIESGTMAVTEKKSV